MKICEVTGLRTEECSRCERTLTKFIQRFEKEYENAWAEHSRLQALYREVCWYNFETACRSWGPPWPTSHPESAVELHGRRLTQWYNRGHLYEKMSFPVYFHGRVKDAPPLPPIIILKELKDAEEYKDHCEMQRTVPIDWAPGGSKYKELVKNTMVGKVSNEKVS